MKRHNSRRGIHRSLTAGVVALTLFGAAVQGAAAAGASTGIRPADGCTRTITGTHHGGLEAASGTLCLEQATQSGRVRVLPGASLRADGSTITGAVTAAQARSVRVCQSALLGGLQADRTAGAVTLGGPGCGADTGHAPVAVTGSAGPVQVAGLRQQGAVTLTGNTGGVSVSAGSVAGTVTVSSNQGSAAVVIKGNAITGSLTCASNSPAPGDAGQTNTVSGQASGQCAGLVPSPPRLQAAPPLDQDLSSTLPNLNYGQAVGSFTGVGHDQIASAQNGQLVISDVAKYGAGVAKASPTDLKDTSNDGFGECGCASGDWPVWDNNPYSRYNDYLNNGAAFSLTGTKVAASSSNIYMAGATWDDQSNTPVDSYRLHLYKLPHDGPLRCAEAGCEGVQSVGLPSTYSAGDAPNHRQDLVVVTSLTTGVVGGQTLIAVGLSDDGVLIFNSQLQQVNELANFEDGGNPPTQTPVTALAFGPDGRLAAGAESPGAVLAGYQLNPDGSTKSAWVSRTGSDWPLFPTAVTYAYLGGQLAEVVVRSDGNVLEVNPDTGDLITGQRLPGAAISVSPVTPPGGDPDNQDLVIGKLSHTGDQVLQDLDGTLTTVPFGSGTTGTPDQVYNWWPGYASGRLLVSNETGGPLSVSMASRPDPGYGCWLDTSVAHPQVPAFPTDPTLVNDASPAYFIGALTTGPDGDCASAQRDSKGEWSAYVIIAPEDNPTDQHLVKLWADPSAGREHILKIANQVGGDLTATLLRYDFTGTYWGSWDLDISGPGRPAASAAPTVSGARLTSAPPDSYQPPDVPPADDPCRPVVRFAVTKAQWNVAGAAGQVTAQIPAMTAQSSSDGGASWQNLGQLMPSTAPSRSGDVVTLGPTSFYFQNAPGTATAPGVEPAGQDQCPATGKAPVTEVRVVSGRLASAPVMLATLAAPPVDGGDGATPVSALAAGPDTGGIATPRANGVDQAGLTLKLTPKGSTGEIDPSDPRYQLVYYRVADTHTLVTGLYQADDYADYTAVGPYAADGAARPTHGFLVTTSTAEQSLNAVMNDFGTGKGLSSSAFAAAASENPLTASGTAVGGISVVGCASSLNAICTLGVPTAPVLYQAGGPAEGPATGLLLQSVAITSQASLPLQVGTPNDHQLGTAVLDVKPSQAKLKNTSLFFPSDSIDTALVTSGELVPALGIPVVGN